MVATEKQIQIVLSRLNDIQSCAVCGTAFRFGDYECPHCGADLEDALRGWAERVIDALGLENESG